MIVNMTSNKFTKTKKKKKKKELKSYIKTINPSFDDARMKDWYTKAKRNDKQKLIKYYVDNKPFTSFPHVLKHFFPDAKEAREEKKKKIIVTSETIKTTKQPTENKKVSNKTPDWKKKLNKKLKEVSLLLLVTYLINIEK